MRLFITTLSMFSVISFGYALAGYGGTLFGREARLDYIIFGLLLGFAFAGTALWLWYKHREDFFVEIDESGNTLPSADQTPTITGESRDGCEKLNSGEINNNADV